MSTEFVNFWKPFTRVFQALCVSHYSVFRPRLRNSYLKSLPFFIYSIIRPTVQLAILFSTCNMKFCSSEDREEKCRGSLLMYYVNALSVFGSVVAHVTMYAEAIFCRKREMEIYERLQTISEIFESRLNYPLNYKSLRAEYLRVAGFFLFTVILAFSTSFSKLPTLYDDKFFMTPLMVTGVIASRARWCQMALFLKILADNLKHLQIALKQHQFQSCENVNEHPENRFERENIQHFREIYSNCWCIVTDMSEYFGWSMIAFLAKTTLESINGSYWFYVNQNSFDSSQLNFRKMKKEILIILS